VINLPELNWQEFELLVEQILRREGFQISNRSRPGTVGPDLEAVSPDGKKVFVDVRHFTRTAVGSKMIVQFADDIRRYQVQFPDARGLLIFSGEISSTAARALAEYSGIDLWSGSSVMARLSQYPDIVHTLSTITLARRSLAEAANVAVPSITDIVAGYTKKLAAIPTGHEGWQDYERLGTEILTKIFSPALGAPDIQIRSDDKLDIVDAIFPIRAVTHPWGTVRLEHKTRFVVAEFKNYVDPIGQTEVEAIAQYLWHKAQRLFGILVTRLPPSTQALVQRRRAWIEHDKMIVILTDDDLLEMLQLWEDGCEPYDIINAQLEEFLRPLSP
jgi:hypothetical protein